MSAAPDIFKIARNTRRRRVIELPGVIRKAVIQYGLEPQTVQPVTLVGTSGRYDHVCPWRCANIMVGGGQVKRVGTRHLRVAGRTAEKALQILQQFLQLVHIGGVTDKAYLAVEHSIEESLLRWLSKDT